MMMGSIEVNRTRLLIGMLIALVGSLSIHVVMLQVLGIPFPEFDGVSPWAPFLNTGLSVLSVIIFYSLARPRLVQFPMVIQYLVVFLLYAMLKESFRGILINGVVTTGWEFDIVAGLPSLASAFVLTSLVVLLTPRLDALWMKVTAASAIAAFVIFAVRPLVRSAFAPALRAAAPLNHADVYAFPYGWHVLLPAYITYAEPVIACTLLAALIWQALSTRIEVRLMQFVLIILLVRGMLLPTLIYSFYSKLPLLSAMLSQSQFLFETIALGLLTAGAWQLSTSSTSLDRSASESIT